MIILATDVPYVQLCMYLYYGVCNQACQEVLIPLVTLILTPVTYFMV